MFTRQVFCAVLSLSLFLSFCSSEMAESVSTEMAMTKTQTQEEDEINELTNQIRLDKFDLILPEVMRDHNIDMWIHVMREAISDPFGAEDLGSASGVFVFTDRGGDRIERAVLGRRFIDLGSSNEETRRLSTTTVMSGGIAEISTVFSTDLVEESGAYDIIGEPVERKELPGGPETELDQRFKDIGEFVAERDPRRIGVNFLEKHGSHVGDISEDGISHTDYILLAKALGDKYAKRLVSSEYLLHDYISRPVKSEFALYKRMRQYSAETHERDWAKIVPGVTKFSDLEAGLYVVDKNGNRIGWAAPLDPGRSTAAERSDDYVIQRGDLIHLRLGYHSSYHGASGLELKFGNFYEHIDEIGYVLREGETEPPPEINKAWADVMKIHDILEDNMKVGRAGTEIYEISGRELDEAGFIVNDSQEYSKDLDPDKTQVNIDAHAAAQEMSTFPAPRIGSYGPDWHHDMKIPLNHHFFFEYSVYIPMPERGVGKHLMIQMHDGAIVTERGVEYVTPPPREIRLIQ
jgi:hypothetical protein